eukprot:m.24466 g.24466  ORF g.24466 m.24466 type:complete len:231 (+) comp4163_c0_seq1:247-939(+)
MDYLESKDVTVYLKDATAQLLKHRANCPTRAAALTFLAEYFRTLRFGRHVLFRETDFVMATRHNRLSFVRCVEYVVGPADASASASSGGEDGWLSAADYHNCITLICKDFPLDLVLKATEMHLMDVSHGVESRLPLAAFMRAFRVQVVYNEFLQKCRVAFDGLARKTMDGVVSTASFVQRLQTVHSPPREAAIPMVHVERALRSVGSTSDVLKILHALAMSSAVFDSATQ